MDAFSERPPSPVLHSTIGARGRTNDSGTPLVICPFLTKRASCASIKPTGRYPTEGRVTSQQRGEATRQRILQAAQESFADQGYDATGVAEICRRAGVTKGGFYHHFPSKQALFLELVDGWLSGLDALLEAIRQGSETVPDAIMQMAGMVEEVFHAASGQVPMFLEFWNRAARDPLVWQATIAPYRRYRAYFAGLIEEGIAEGSLRAVDPDLASHLIVSVAVGLVLQGLLDPQGADWGQLARDGIRMLLSDMERR